MLTDLPRLSTSTRTARPRAVIWAAWVLWTSFALQIIATALGLLRSGPGSPLWASLLGIALGAALFFWWVAGLLAGRNWARVIFLILSLLGLAYAKWYFEGQSPLLAAGDPVAVLRLLRILLDYGALGLLFAPEARAWFANGSGYA
jgi:hypothetical protein